VRYLGIPASGVTTTAYRTVTDTTATAGQTSFTIPSYTVGYVDVFRNGVRLAAADYTATTGTTVVLVNGATVGDTITTVSFYVSSVLNAIPATDGAVNTTYIADSAITTAKIAAGAVTQADLDTLVVPIGVGQTWQNVAGSRALGTTYTNSTGKPIAVSTQVQSTTNGTNTIVIAGVTAVQTTTTANLGTTMFAIVPNGATYVVDNNQASKSIITWAELR